MQRDELTAAGELAGEAAVALVGQAEHVHRTIARRVWSGIGPISTPVRLLHDGIARGVYATTKLSLKTTTRAGALALSATARSDSAPRFGGSSSGRAMALLNGAVGDRLEHRHSALALPMRLRVDGTDVEATPDDLARAYPDATGKLAVFVHGLGQTEESWLSRGTRYGELLQSEMAYTPVYVRYNSGRPVSENGAELVQLLDLLLSGWPAEVDEVVLVGHSVGGLIARHALHGATQRPWIARVRALFTLGTPHEGMALERVTRTASSVLARLPDTRPLADVLELRSAGVRDFGRGSGAPFAPGVAHYFLSGGASVVSRRSAWAQASPRQPVEFPVENYCHIAGIAPFALAGHPAVYAQLRRWLSGPALPPPRRALPRPDAGAQRP